MFYNRHSLRKSFYALYFQVRIAGPWNRLKRGCRVYGMGGWVPGPIDARKELPGRISQLELTLHRWLAQRTRDPGSQNLDAVTRMGRAFQTGGYAAFF